MSPGHCRSAWRLDGVAAFDSRPAAVMRRGGRHRAMVGIATVRRVAIYVGIGLNGVIRGSYPVGRIPPPSRLEGLLGICPLHPRPRKLGLLRILVPQQGR